MEASQRSVALIKYYRNYYALDSLRILRVLAAPVGNNNSQPVASKISAITKYSSTVREIKHSFKKKLNIRSRMIPGVLEIQRTMDNVLLNCHRLDHQRIYRVL